MTQPDMSSTPSREASEPPAWVAEMLIQIADAMVDAAEEIAALHDLGWDVPRSQEEGG